MSNASPAEDYAVPFGEELAAIIRSSRDEHQAPRVCKGCGAGLRSGNQDKLCAPCKDAIVTPPAPKIELPRCAHPSCNRTLRADNQSGFCGPHRPDHRYTKVSEREVPGPNDIAHEETHEMAKETTAPLRICSREGCNRTLAANNQSGRCGAHWYQAKTPRGTGERVKGYTKAAKAEAPVNSSPSAPEANTPRELRTTLNGVVVVNGRRYVADDLESEAQLHLANGCEISVSVDAASPEKAKAFLNDRKIADLIMESLASWPPAPKSDPAPESEAMTLTITGKQADKFFTALKPEDKCRALQGLFDQLEA